jgi:acetyl-CoA carboxylase biotin carboxyl carrier protein
MASVTVRSEIAGSVWKIEAEIGTPLSEEQTILILESMKMEIPVLAPRAGKLVEICVAESDSVSEGQVVAKIEV